MNFGLGLFSLSVLLSRGWARFKVGLDSAPSTCPARRCVYYVTGHGFGHAARSVVMIRALIDAGYDVQVVSAVPEGFFRQSIPEVAVHQRRLDSGAVQADALNVDALKSLETYKSTVHDNHSSIVQAEVEFLRRNEADLVITDATPVACAAGRLAGAKVVILSNFCWDFIYTEMTKSLESEPLSDRFRPMIEQVTADYSHSDVIILYPGYNEPLGSYRQLKAPLISRTAGRTKQVVREELGISEGQTVLLLGFGGHQTSWRLEDRFLPPGWVCLVLSSKQSDMPNARFIALGSDIYAPDYVAASDVWIGKLGFGSVSEALAHAVPLIYIPRSSWPEERYLEQYILANNAGLRMPEEAFFSGNWGSFLNAGLDRKRMLRPHDTSKAPRQIVEMISSLF